MVLSSYSRQNPWSLPDDGLQKNHHLINGCKHPKSSRFYGRRPDKVIDARHTGPIISGGLQKGAIKGMEKLDFDITKKPPTQTEIDAEKVWLKHKIKIYRIKVLSASVLMILIAVLMMRWTASPTDTSDIIAAGIIAAAVGAIAGIIGAVGAFVAAMFGIGISIIGIVIAVVAAGTAGAVGATVVSVAAIAVGMAVFGRIKPTENRISALAVSDRNREIKLLRAQDNQVAEYLVQIDKQSRRITVLEYQELSFTAHRAT